MYVLSKYLTYVCLVEGPDAGCQAPPNQGAGRELAGLRSSATLFRGGALANFDLNVQSLSIFRPLPLRTTPDP